MSRRGGPRMPAKNSWVQRFDSPSSISGKTGCIGDVLDVDAGNLPSEARVPRCCRSSRRRHRSRRLNRSAHFVTDHWIYALRTGTHIGHEHPSGGGKNYQRCFVAMFLRIAREVKDVINLHLETIRPLRGRIAAVAREPVFLRLSFSFVSCPERGTECLEIARWCSVFLAELDRSQSAARSLTKAGCSGAVERVHIFSPGGSAG